MHGMVIDHSGISCFHLMTVMSRANRVEDRFVYKNTDTKITFGNIQLLFFHKPFFCAAFSEKSNGGHIFMNFNAMCVYV